MKSFSEILEAKFEKQLVSTCPAAPSEKHFVDKHKIKDTNKDKLEPDNNVFDQSKKTKTFNRKKNRYGNDMADSIKKYDETINLADRLSNAHKRKVRNRHFFDEKGNWIGAAHGAKNNKEALKDLSGKGIKKSKVSVVKEEEETVGEDIEELNEANNKFKVNDYVHMGLGTKGGVGFRGKVSAVEENGMITIERNKDGTEKWGFPKTYKGHYTKYTKEEVINEVSKGTLGSYIKSANLKRGLDQHKKGLYSDDKDSKEFKDADKSSNKRLKGIGMAVDKLTKEESEILEISKDLTKRYLNKSLDDANYHASTLGYNYAYGKKVEKETTQGVRNRLKGINSALNKFPNPKDNVNNIKSHVYNNVKNNFTWDAAGDDDSKKEKLVKKWKGEYPHQHKDKIKNAINSLGENLNPSSGIATYITAFQNSTNENLKGKTKATLREMAIAAYFHDIKINENEYDPEVEFHVFNTKSNSLKGKYSTHKRARNAADKKDNEYGGYAHRVRFFHKEKGEYVQHAFKENIEESASQERTAKDKMLSLLDRFEKRKKN